MWHNHPFSQRNKTTERAVGVGVGGNMEERGLGKIWKREVGNIGVFYKIGGIGHLCQLWTKRSWDLLE